jgi:chromosome segregation ATPase
MQDGRPRGDEWFEGFRRARELRWREPVECDDLVTRQVPNRRRSVLSARFLPAGIRRMGNGRRSDEREARVRRDELFERTCRSLDRYAERMDRRDAVFDRHMEALAERDKVFAGHMASLEEGREVFARQMVALDERDKVFAGHMEALEEGREVFARQMAAIDERSKSFDATMAAIEERGKSFDATMAVFGRRSDALGASVIRLQDTAERWERKTDALIGAITDLAGDVRALMATIERLLEDHSGK